jgi:hypothetical protein
MEAVCSSKTLVTTYQAILCQYEKARNKNLYRRVNVIFLMNVYVSVCLTMLSVLQYFVQWQVEWWTRKDFEGSDRGPIDALSRRLSEETENLRILDVPAAIQTELFLNTNLKFLHWTDLFGPAYWMCGIE